MKQRQVHSSRRGVGALFLPLHYYHTVPHSTGVHSTATIVLVHLGVNVPVLLNAKGWHLLDSSTIHSSGCSHTEVATTTKSTRVGPGEGTVVGVHVKVSLEGVFIIDSVGDSGGEGLGAQVVGWLDSEVIVAVDPAQGQVAVVGAVGRGGRGGWLGLEIVIGREEAGSCQG
jgi:hypothetical protein